MKHPRETEKVDVPIEQELIIGSYRWFTYAPEVTGLRLICLEDLDTGTVVTTTVADRRLRTAAHRAWAGARQSRSAGLPWEILSQMGEKGIDPDQKLEEMFRGYGHASVGDMARLSVDMGRIPMHLCLSLFQEGSINSGQEKSTRYQTTFGKALLHPIKYYLPTHLSKEEGLEADYQSFGTLSRDFFAKHKAVLQEVFGQYYRVDSTDREQRSALTSRVLDCVRSFLLFGQWSGMSFETSARDWSRILSELKASPLSYYHKVAVQIERLLAPSREEEESLGYKAEAPGLIRHTSAQFTTNSNLQTLKQFLMEKTDLLQHAPIQKGFPQLVEQRVELIPPEYTEGDRLVAASILLLWPGLDRAELLKWVQNRDVETKRTIGALLFSGHSNYCELPSYAHTTHMTLVIEGCLGELRDFNRHRAWGRFSPLPLVFGEPVTRDTVDQLLARGFSLPCYLTEIPEMASYKAAMEHDLLAYYASLQEFIAKVAAQYHDTIDYSFVLNLLPLAHRVDLWMHGDPKQALYLTKQRTRSGGHINYRVLAYEASQLLAMSDPYLSALQLESRPDPTSKEEFFDRS
ncbi:MAG TPA: hypothetical protein VHV10_15240 [Ktedonobacteraceae bacterium]|nr:hypothetical protein [Ktedonobacteraceae bacterium]